MPSIASAKTQFFKQLKHTSKKSILSYGTAILFKRLSFTESSALTHPLVCNKGLINCLLYFSPGTWNVDDVIDAWSKQHHSSSLCKGTQAAWDDLAGRDSLNTLLNTKSPWNYSQPLAAQESHCCLVRNVPTCQCWKPAQP